MTANKPPLETLKAIVSTNDPKERIKIYRAANPSESQDDFLAGFRKMMGGEGMRAYGSRIHDEGFPSDSEKTSERMRAKLAAQNHARSIPPILANGLEKVCREQHEDGDISGCVEDELALEEA
jgi:hypothetical protein